MTYKLKIKGKWKPIEKCSDHDIIYGYRRYECSGHMSKEERRKFYLEVYGKALKRFKPKRLDLTNNLKKILKPKIIERKKKNYRD